MTTPSEKTVMESLDFEIKRNKNESFNNGCVQREPESSPGTTRLLAAFDNSKLFNQAVQITHYCPAKELDGLHRRTLLLAAVHLPRPGAAPPTRTPYGNGPGAEPDAARGTRPRQQRPPVPAREAPSAEERPRGGRAGAGTREPRPEREPAPPGPGRLPATRSSFSATDGHPRPAAPPRSAGTGHQRSGTGPYRAPGPPGSPEVPASLPEVPVSPPNSHSMILQSSGSARQSSELVLYGPPVLQDARSAGWTRLLRLWMPHLWMDASWRTSHLQGKVLQNLAATGAPWRLRVWMLVTYASGDGSFLITVLPTV
ncbi:uncharacterized protein LOC141938838 [Strix uralensis]|uniref:uncharacterized protein LOC141938838 n=1 Tax=Strix uralensis TaxID=36305 RepID=UPI003DA44BDD